MLPAPRTAADPLLTQRIRILWNLGKLGRGDLDYFGRTTAVLGQPGAIADPPTLALLNEEPTIFFATVTGRAAHDLALVLFSNRVGSCRRRLRSRIFRSWGRLAFGGRTLSRRLAACGKTQRDSQNNNSIPNLIHRTCSPLDSVFRKHLNRSTQRFANAWN
ncbi:TPA: hypothetical protein UN036_001078 [Stenotrophomonas maltophilia]|uniref:hypothetical protein n=1 Tax=Stenotrophomonas maltophilia TaxID=40324 RepID=UPI0012B31A5E|nr:hypothetical protein [Stenotrophomonas maltophilia]EKT4103252.1 hypothetical protein [Stenotrophomonas maltophilia]MBH1538120.1 hypothetical protein [Stenotrophomonas maltophilia]MCU1096055.1 hypothetical protein [Stenotrophomonas maltophilia]HDS1391784.1 hypothetical protein [Stenotrophomonas maltophilia]HDS1610038.1 hypothetical protein [Stenotrophomonas maltophilia]